ncbi:MAG: peptidoglycan DD-metalloendopeptidase family protein [Desulfobacterales bacterium]|nr:peptidoglycan DD-metalloendopeptidase family protein [Desulfobacterales bacterium]
MRVLIAILVVACFFPSPSWAQGKRELDKTIQKKKGDLTKVEKELTEKKQEVKKKWWEEKRITDALDKSERQLDRKKTELRELDAEMKVLEQKVARQEEEIARLETQLTVLGEMFQSRVRAMYKLHRVGVVRVLFSAEDYSDALRRYKAFQLVVGNDLQLLQSYQQGIEEEKNRKQDLIAEKAALAKKRGEVEAKKGEVEREMRKKAILLAAVQNERATSEMAIAELKEREKALRSLIQQLTIKAAALKTTGFRALRGKLPPPVEGNIFSPKGREHGIGIEAPEGAQIQAIYNGKVAYASWFKGYGNLLIIDHGEGYHSVAAHASRLLKKVGDEVRMGETVALVGSTGSIEGPMLYFEIRHHGTAEDPLTWLALPNKGQRK